MSQIIALLAIAVVLAIAIAAQAVQIRRQNREARADIAWRQMLAASSRRNYCRVHHTHHNDETPV